MVENNPGDIHQSKDRLQFLLSFLDVWALPGFFWLSLKSGSGKLLFGLALLWWIGNGIVLLRNRHKPFSVHVWIPLLAAPLIFLLAVFSQLELGSSSGPGAPLEGVASLLGLVLMACFGGAFILALRFRPKVYRPINIVCGIANTALVIWVLFAIHAHSARLEIHLTLLDRAGSSIPGARVSFDRYRQGPGDSKLHMGTSRPFLTSLHGSVVLYSQRLLTETRINISKPGYRKLQLMLPMQFRPDEKERRIILSTEETSALATLLLPSNETLPITLALPPSDEAPDPNLKHIHFLSARDSSPLPERYLDIETGTLTRDLTEASDLELEVTGFYGETTLRLKGLGGTLLTAVDSKKPESYEAIYRIAPKDGYTPEIEIKRPGDSPPRFMVYLRLPTGDRYARMSITALGDGVHNKVRFDGQIHINESGSRFLE